MFCTCFTLNNVSTDHKHPKMEPRMIIPRFVSEVPESSFLWPQIQELGSI